VQYSTVFGIVSKEKSVKTFRPSPFYWGHLSKLIPHYEVFWRDHVFPLRVPAQIWLRDALDPNFEAVAIANYSTFVSLGRARQKIFVDHENYKFVEEHYAALQRSCGLGIKLIQKFDDLYESLVGQRCGVSVAKLEQFIEKAGQISQPAARRDALNAER
jgi:hypothetical protein